MKSTRYESDMLEYTTHIVTKKVTGKISRSVIKYEDKVECDLPTSWFESVPWIY